MDRHAPPVSERSDICLIADLRDLRLGDLAGDARYAAAIVADRILAGMEGPSRVQAMAFQSAI